MSQAKTTTMKKRMLRIHLKSLNFISSYVPNQNLNVHNLGKLKMVPKLATASWEIIVVLVIVCENG